MEERILLIEDDESFRKTLTTLLEKEGYSVNPTGSADQAISEAKRNLFELIIADIRLPGGMDGIEAAKTIKEIRPQVKTMVIVITGYANENAPIRAIQVGVDDYIYKPFRMEEFLHSVERNVKMHRLEKARDQYFEKLEKINRELKAAQAELINSKNQLERCNVELETEIEKRTKQLKQTEAQLVQSAKISALGQLGAGVAHELNNPIGGILGYAQFILQKFGKGEIKPKDMDRCRQYIQYIEREAKRCKNIVAELLVFSRKPQEGFESLDIKKTLEKTLTIIEYQMKTQHIKITSEFEPSLPRIVGNVNQLQQVFSNMIINAQHAMPKGGKLDIRIATENKGKEKQVVITFKDTGCGIPEKNLENIFEPFFTTKQDWKSIGIGLSITYQIIQEHKGTVTVESEEDKGTTFTVSLPVAP